MSVFGLFEAFLIIIGFCVILLVFGVMTAKFLDGVRVFVIPLWKRNDIKGFGDWAVVTGASSGIGKSYSRQLANFGYNVLLCSNEPTELEGTAREIETEYGVSTVTVCIDFSEDSNAYKNIENEIKAKEIGVLVNNVGSRGKQPCYFLEETDMSLKAVANINCLSAVIMTNMILPQMLKRNRGIIINIASVGAVLPMSFGSTYSASKAFVDYFTKALQSEYRKTDLIIQSVFPFYVSTRMTQFSDDFTKPNLLVPDSESYVRNAIRTVGVKSVTTGYWPHAIMCAVLLSLPVSFVQYLNLLQVQNLKARKETPPTQKDLKT